MEQKIYDTLKERARVLRLQICNLAREGHGNHLGGSFSCVEILISLYKKVLTNEDKFLLGKGHAALALYPLLLDCGYTPKITEHPYMDCSNGIHCTSGSLGMGLPFGTGIALARKIRGTPGRVYVLLGEAECQEGTTWESLLIASQHKLSNLAFVVDKNNYQSSGFVDDVLSLGDLESKFNSFGCFTQNVDGHSYEELLKAFANLSSEKCNAIIANTIKGKGTKLMEEDQGSWHCRLPTTEQFKQVYTDLGEEFNEN
jgi:transketolase